MAAVDRVQRLAEALTQLQAGAWRSAELAAKAALDTDPDDIEAMVLLGLAIAAGGEATRAAVIMDRVARARPDFDHPCLDLARLQPSLPRRVIERQFQACLRLGPENHRLRLGFASYLLDNDGATEAVTLLRDGPDTPQANHLRGMAQAEAGMFDRAIRSFRSVIAADPRPAEAWANLGMMLKVEDRFDEAITAYDEAVVRAPRDARIRVNRAVALLRAGRWQEAWGDYEWRLRLPERRGLPLSALLPAVDALDDLHGVTILATHEEGFGDTLQFMRYLPLLAERGARVLAWVPRQLARVTATLPGVAVLTGSDPVPDYDFHCPMLSLPRAFETSVATIPAAPYLAPDPARVAAWGGQLPSDGFRIGIVWAGQARPWQPGFNTVDRRRSVHLGLFSPLAAIPGVTLVSLQSGSAGRHAQSPPRGMTIIDAMTGVEDFADTAAIIANLDLVISVDTAVVHLAGAMGRPVFMLDRYDNCWRWLNGRADSPWYPSLTIFRQHRIHDWSAAMTRVVAAVEALVAFRGPPAPATRGRPSRMRALANAA